MKKNIVIIGTLDTKGKEFQFVKDIIESQGISTTVIDVGVVGEPYFTPDITKEEVSSRCGVTIAELIGKKDRGYALDVMMRGCGEIVKELYENKKLDGVISLGGSGGTSVATYAMRQLEVGVPKVMVSTLASGDTTPYVGEKDITMMYSVVDISGVNRISSKIFSNAANAIVGMVKGEEIELEEERPLIGATMFGVTTEAVTKATEYLEDQGFEVLIFHATGSGGKAMEHLISSGYIKGVLDLTTTELCDELVGGVLSAGPDRLTAASKKGVPQVVSTGAMDMVNFGPIETVPDKFKNRKLYKHNATVTLMRTTVEENRELGKILAEKLNKSVGDTVLCLPLKGISAIDKEGQVFYGKEEDEVLFESIRNHIDNKKVKLVEIDSHINDSNFALYMAKTLTELIDKNN
ncbi:hypothetical protein CLPU_8c01260 [Gottschalkia purinilytica]|uniref:Uncharacterized protein n=1 Tax=Gottschalkia purinilytica TaxID=1503 RepID=A0A0L0WA66_GOTPU|nr:Tm-1-like ATP-binding domain-containing protein [Gottschalkia purinilytica]KNF08361.1 hypothetical protein CLPU_8c01260 [Gottschalkia purinilytica]